MNEIALNNSLSDTGIRETPRRKLIIIPWRRRGVGQGGLPDMGLTNRGEHSRQGAIANTKG